MKKVLVLIVLLGGMVLAGCAAARQSQSTTASGGDTVIMTASWATWYSDIHSLKANSDLGVLGSFTAVQGQTQDKNGTPFTDFAFTVTRVLWNPKQVSAGVVSIHQTGGTVNGSLYQFSDDPLFQVGEQAILFLHETSPGHYYVVGGPSGRFHVNNGMVTPATAHGVPFAGPRPLNSFLADVASA
jgi:hypothetical protein